MKRLIPFFMLMLLLLVACAAPIAVPTGTVQAPLTTPGIPTELPHPITVTVFADDSLSNSFAQMAADVQASHPGLIVKIHFGDTQALRKEIEQGAQADVFASADPAEVAALAAGNYLDAQSSSAFLVNQLVVVLPALNTANLSSLQDLTRPGLKLVLAADQTTLGKYSQQALDKLDKTLGDGYKAKFLKNVSYEQDVSQVLRTIQLGKADAGIVFFSDSSAATNLPTIQIPNESNLLAKYTLAVLSKSANPGLARAFVDYVLSPNGESILQKWGFLQDR